MSGGGGGYQAPQDNSLQLAQMQYQHEAELQRQADAKQAKLDAEFKTNLSNAATSARGTGNSILANRGLDSAKYGSVIENAITDELARVPRGDPNPANYFTSDLINNALTGYQSDRQAKNTTQVNSVFNPGFESGALPDTLDDSYINKILGTQEASAKQALLAAQQRGQLTDVGLNAANATLGTQRTGAKSTLDSIGSGVLATDRAGLKSVRDNALTAGSGWQLGDTDFSLDPYTGQRDTKLKGYTDNLEGDITNALGSTPLFNVNSILMSGSAAQGPRNLTTAGLPGQPVRKNNTDRGLGSTGATF